MLVIIRTLRTNLTTHNIMTQEAFRYLHNLSSLETTNSKALIKCSLPNNLCSKCLSFLYTPYARIRLLIKQFQNPLQHKIKRGSREQAPNNVILALTSNGIVHQ